MKCLIIQTAFLGDVILATALAEKIKQQHPESAVHFLLRKGNEKLLEGHPHIDKLLVWDKKKKFRDLRRLLGEVRRAKYDAAVNVQRFAASGLLTAFSGAKTTIGFDKNPLSFLFSLKVEHRQKGVHETERNQKLIASFTTGKAARPALYPSPHDFENVKHLKNSSYVCVAPTSVWFTKQWAFHKWVELIEKLVVHHQVYLLGAPNEADFCSRIAAHFPARAVNAAGKLSLLESAALMKGAQMNYVNDSAPLHIASAMNAPVTAIFCSTLPSFGFGPLSDVSHCAEAKEELPCRPCGLHGKKRCPEGHFHCAEKISIQQFLIPSA